MEQFKNWSIRRKLTALFLAMACIGASALSLPIVAFDYFGLKRAMSQDLTVLADVLARNSTAAITFRDAVAAREVLQALRAEPAVTAACLYSESGKPFAIYVRDGKEADFVPPRVEAKALRFDRDHLFVFRSIVLAGDPVGAIYIESDLTNLRARLRAYTLIILATMAFTLGLAFLVAGRFQQPIAGPLLDLVRTAKAVSISADYSIRAELLSHDEYGQLVAAFNAMLNQIETQDRKLRAHREQLEAEVAARTAELQAKNAQLRLQGTSLEAAANSIVITDRQGKVVWTNRAFSEMTGYEEAEIVGKTLSLVKSGKQDRDFYSNLWTTITAGKKWQGELINRRKDGTHYIEEMTITPVLSDGGITNFVGIKQDITERKRSEEALRRAEEKYRTIFEDAIIGIFQITPDGRPLSINRALARMHGYDSPEQFIAEVKNVPEQLFVHPQRLHDLAKDLDRDFLVHGVELEVYRKSGSTKWVMVNMRGVRDADNKVLLYEGTVEDITERKVAEQRVQFLAYYDALTELPNRTLLQDRLEKAFAVAQRRKERVAILFLDLDRFKVINDSLGHSVGDLLLQGVAERLKQQARMQDTVARLGGDEFVVVLPGINDPVDAAVVAQRIVKAMTAEFLIHGRSLNIACSLGISIFPDHGADAESLVKNADAAMYHAKENGRCNFQFFTQDMNARAVERLTLENDLRLALARNELFLMYQPQMAIDSGEICGLEALLRWRHPERGLVPPDNFIRVAENSGLIVPMGEWVLRTACTQARQWHVENVIAVPVAVNVSAVQFRQESFLDLVSGVLQETGLDANYLELELTEGLLLSTADRTLSMLSKLKEMGVKLAIDDFGTGYSSLSYLRQFPVSRLKIDRSFITEVATNPDDAAITGTVISMAKNLNLKVIAEGVETEDQMAFLRAHHCDEIQGYYFSEPLKADELAATLRCRALTAGAGR